MSDQAWTMAHGYVYSKAVMCFLIESPQEKQDKWWNELLHETKLEMELYGEKLGPQRPFRHCH